MSEHFSIKVKTTYDLFGPNKVYQERGGISQFESEYMKTDVGCQESMMQCTVDAINLKHLF